MRWGARRRSRRRSSIEGRLPARLKAITARHIRRWPNTSPAPACRDAPGRAVDREFDDGHGRLVRRRVFVSTEAAALRLCVAGRSAHAVLAVETIRSVNGTAKTVAKWRYYLTSGHDEPGVLAGRSVRIGRSRTTALGARCDVQRGRKPGARSDRSRNLAVLRKIALNLISRDQASKTSKRASGRRPPGTITTCSSYSAHSRHSMCKIETNLMRCPCG